jgi:hypothetical protein
MVPRYSTNGRYVHVYTCSYCQYVHVYVRTYQWYVRVRTYVRTYYTCTYLKCYVTTSVYHGPMDPYQYVYVRTYHGVYVYVRTYVRTTIGIMLFHNFLIGKGHTCALRTTCVLGGYQAAS